MNIYLCSRVAYDARPLNNDVAQRLRDAGHAVYVPHEQAPNNLTAVEIEDGRYDKKTIFRLDYGAMQKAQLCVVVGRVGRDCAWEIGWFYAMNIPLIHVPAGVFDYETSPMLLPALTERQSAVFNVADVVEEYAAKL